MAFTDRSDAGKRLAVALEGYRDERPILLALPRGGVPVAAEVAAALNAPLDLILVRKIGVPGESELAMGAVVDGAMPTVVRNDKVILALGISESKFESARQRELAEIERRRQRYLGSRSRIEVNARTVIVVDDGMATGATMRAAIGAIRTRRPRKIVLAIPVAPADTLAAMRNEVDHVVCLESYQFFGSIDAYYADFRQVSDEEVTAALASFADIDAGGHRGGGDPIGRPATR